MLLSEIDVHAPVMGIFKGESGTGKTIAACSFPQPLKVWSLDDRMKSAAMYLREHNHPVDQIEVQAYGADDFVRFIDTFGEAAEQFSGEATFRSGEPFKTFVLDGLTSLGTMILTYCMSIRGVHKSGKERQKGIIRLPEIEDFMGESNALEKILSYARQINERAHFIMTAHVVISKMFDIESKQYKESRSLLTGGAKVAAKVPIYFDEIWHFEADTEFSEEGGNSVYKARTQHAGRDFARTALPLPSVMEWTNSILWPQVEKFLPPKDENTQTQT